VSAEGAATFARFAYPPNALGYCGPADAQGTLRAGAGAGPEQGPVDEDEVLALARRFEGAWPYLELLAGDGGDPLAADVVDGYWLGNDRSARIDADAFARHLHDRVGDRLGVPWESVAEAIAGGGRPTHAFHVLSASPFVALARRGAIDQALRVIDGCRIAPGEVVAVDGEEATVRIEPLVWRTGAVRRGAPEERRVRCPGDGLLAGEPLSAGDRVAVHWDWVCDRLDAQRWAGLRAAQDQQLELVERLGRVHDGP
jgi:hypothetical protein